MAKTPKGVLQHVLHVVEFLLFLRTRLWCGDHGRKAFAGTLFLQQGSDEGVVYFSAGLQLRVFEHVVAKPFELAEVALPVEAADAGQSFVANTKERLRQSGVAGLVEQLGDVHTALPVPPVKGEQGANELEPGPGVVAARWLGWWWGKGQGD
ncbi:hypothetical protein D3C86_1608170 [compost metagenome]